MTNRRIGPRLDESATPVHQLSEVRRRSLTRVTKLRKQAAEDGQEPQIGKMLEALRELDITLEELRVVEEDLQRHVDEISRARGALEIEGGRYRDLFEDAPAPFFVTDRQGIVLECNRRACALLGFEQVFLTGKSITLHVDEADRMLVRKMLDLFDTFSSIRSLELRIRPRGSDGPIRTYANVSCAAPRPGLPASLRWILQVMLAQSGDETSELTGRSRS